MKNAHNELVREWSLASRIEHNRRTASGSHNYRCTLTVFLISAATKPELGLPMQRDGHISITFSRMGYQSQESKPKIT